MAIVFEERFKGLKAEQRRRLLTWFIGLILAVATLTAFWPVRTHDFVLFDDDLYVTENTHVKEGLSFEGLIWAFTSTRAFNWHPLTWLSHMLDCAMYGLNAGGHHVTSVLFHLASVVLLFLVFRRMTGKLWQSGFIAGLFALHPLHVEPVAWVAERKDVLSTFFWMMTLWAYVRYVNQKVEGRGSKVERNTVFGAQVRSYVLVVAFFVLGLLSKPMLVTLPFVLLLLDFWPLGRFQPDRWRIQVLPLIGEKIPFFILSAASSVATFLVQQSTGAVVTGAILPLKLRVANAFVSYVSYIFKMLWPQHLAVLYPYPKQFSVWQLVAAASAMACVSSLVVLASRKRPYLLVGWFWYVGTLVPVIGLVQVGWQSMADRYTYVPLIGLFIMVTMAAAEITTRWRLQRAVPAVASGLLLVALVFMTRSQVVHWRHTETLFNHTLAGTIDNFLIHNNLGVLLYNQGKMDEAIAHFTETVRIRPDHVGALNNLGNAFVRQGRIQEATAKYAEALRLKPDYAEAYNNLGNALAALGKHREAIDAYTKAVKIKPDYAQAYFSLGLAFVMAGDRNLALQQYKILRPIDSDLAHRLLFRIPGW